MAVTGSISFSVGSQDVAANKTYVTVYFKATTTNSSYNGNQKSGKLTIYDINGKSYSYSFTHDLPKTSTTTLKSVGIWIPHNSNGVGLIRASGSYDTGTGSKTITASNSRSLATIPRVSDISVNKSSVPADESTAITVTTSKKSSSFSDTIIVKLGDYSKEVTSGSAFTIPKEWINAISGTSAAATATVTTKSGSTTIGSKSASFTVTVPDDVKPVINGISVTEAITSVTSWFGNRFIKTLSQLNVSVNADGVYGSTINAYNTKIDGVTYSTKDFQTNALNNAGTVNIVATVTDSRGRTASYTKAITVVDYTPPAITSMTYYSCKADGTRDSSGTNTKIIIAGIVSSVAGQNAKSLVLSYKALNDTAYTDRTLTISDWNFEVSTIISNTDPTSTWEFVAKLSDKVASGESAITYRIVTGVPVISRLAGGGGVALFGEAEDAGFKVAGGKSSTFTGDILIEDSALESLWNSVFGSGG